ncbi:MAG: LLM class flavin-dependent oxidoreductase [Candidatus Binatia bacterium]
MKFGLTFAPYSTPHRKAEDVFRAQVEQVKLAEEVGFDSAFVSEHHFLDNEMFPSPLVALGFLAAVTSKIKLGTGVLLLPLHEPVRVAEDAAVFDRISGGRLIFGVGQGYRPEEFSGYGRRLEDRNGLMREGATLVRRLWTEENVTFHGKHFHLNGVNLTPKPAQRPAPPIWVAAKKRHAVELAAQVGDCWYPDPITPLPIIAQNKQHWLAALKKHGKNPADQELAYYREFFVGKDADSAWRLGSPGLMGEYSFYLSVNHLVDDSGTPIPSSRTDLLEDIVRDRCTIGDPQHCIQHLQRIKDMINPTHMVLKMSHVEVPHEHVMDSIKLAAKTVLPAFR